MAVEQIRPVRDIGYYLAEPTLNTPVFEGTAARIMGIHGSPATPEAVTQLFGGCTPDGRRLAKYMHPKRRGAFEVTVNLSKCASTMALVAGDSRIQGVLDDAAAKAAEYLQENARVRVTKREEVERSKESMPKGWRYPERKSQNLAWAIYAHPSSRAGDPHLHAHLVFFNLSFDRQERTWKAIETRYIDQRRLGEIVRDSTVKGLRQLGYRVRVRGNEFDIVGVPAEVKAEFSQRNAKIKEMEAEYAARIGKEMSSKAKGKLAVFRRPEKQFMILAERKADWLARLTEKQLRRLTDLAKSAKEAVRTARMKRNLALHLERSRQTVEEAGHGRTR